MILALQRWLGVSHSHPIGLHSWVPMDVHMIANSFKIELACILLSFNRIRNPPTLWFSRTTFTFQSLFWWAYSPFFAPTPNLFLKDWEFLWKSSSSHSCGFCDKKRHICRFLLQPDPERLLESFLATATTVPNQAHHRYCCLVLLRLDSDRRKALPFRRETSPSIRSTVQKRIQNNGSDNKTS